MKKLLAVLLFSASLFFFIPQAVIQTYAAVDAGSGGAGNSKSSKTVDKALKSTTQGTQKFTSGTPNVTGLQSYLVEVTATTLFLCNFEATGCTGDQTQQAPITMFNKMFVALYTPPATSQLYLADLMNSAGLNIAKPAYAQGLGFAALNPILDTWKVFRNVAYLFYVILFLVIGFAIMFRQKLSGQAAVTAQQALPKIVVSLIAVTFSYAIAGLLIELMYISMYLILNLFPNEFFGVAQDRFSLREVALDSNIFQVGILLLTKAGTMGNAYDSVKAIVDATFSSLNEQTASALGWISGLTFAVIFAIATMFGIFRLFFELLKTYISIIITIVLSPLALMLDALPGRNALSAWLKTLIANLAVFPGVLIILTLAFMLIGNAYNVPSGDGFNVGSSGGFLPPYIPGDGSANAVSVLLGLGVILILPDLATSIKKTLGGSGGIFEQFANNFTSSVEKGWKGDKLVPGVGLSDTRKWLGKQTGGLSGENLSRKGAIAASNLAGRGIGAARATGGLIVKKASGNKLLTHWQTDNFGDIMQEQGRVGRQLGKFTANKLKDPNFADKDKTG